MVTPSEKITHFLLDWKLGFLFMLAGIVLGAAVYFVLPGDYQAKATVVVDMNVEENWVGSPDNEIFYFLDRETRKLEEFAWSDTVMSKVSEEMGTPITKLREEVLSLSQPKDGGWHFFARSADRALAEHAAASWAVAFADGVNAELSGGNTRGLLENITVSATQVENLPVERTGSLSVDSLVGALGGWLTGILLILFRKK